MGQSITLAIPIVADSGNYEIALQRVKSRAQEAAQTITALQQRIDSQFQKAGGDFASELQRSIQMRQAIKESVLSTDPYHAATAGSWLPGNRAGNSAEIQQRMEAMVALQRELFETTATPKEVAIRNLEEQLEPLKDSFRDNQQMMTLIQEVETAKRKRIDEEYHSFFSRSQQRAIMMFMRMGVYGYLASAAFQGLTDASKAMRSGESAMQAFIDKIPGIGIVNKALRELAMELSGVNAQAEEAKISAETLDKLSNSFIKTSRGFQEIGKSGFDKQLDAFGYTAADAAREADIEIEKLQKRIEGLKAGMTPSVLTTFSPIGATWKYITTRNSPEAVATAESDIAMWRAKKKHDEELCALQTETAFKKELDEIELQYQRDLADEAAIWRDIDEEAKQTSINQLDMMNKLEEEVRGLQTSLETWGMGNYESQLYKAEKELDKLWRTSAEGADAFIEQLIKIEGQTDKIAVLKDLVSKEEAEKSVDFAKQVRESILTPVEQFKKYREELEKLGTDLTPAEKELALTNKMGELMDRGGGRTAANDFSVIENASYRSLASITQTREDPAVAELRELLKVNQESSGTLKTIATNTKDGGLR